MYNTAFDYMLFHAKLLLLKLLKCVDFMKDRKDNLGKMKNDTKEEQVNWLHRLSFITIIQKESL